MTRTWRMFAGRVSDPRVGREFMNFGSERTVRMYGREPVAVELTEDPAGDYYGWIDADRPGGRFAPKYTGVPTLVQPHEGMFTMQFPYGPHVLARDGRGEIVRMTCRAVDESGS
jgi:hypothetical protein